MHPVKVKGKFSEETDLLLLRESLAIDAFSFPSGSGWRAVAERLHKTGKVWESLTARTCRERVALVLDRYKEELDENETSMIKRELDPTDEKTALLQRLLQLRNEAMQRRKMTTEERAEESRLIRERAEKNKLTISDALRKKIIKIIGQATSDEPSAFQSSETCSLLEFTPNIEAEDTFDSIDSQQGAEIQDANTFDSIDLQQSAERQEETYSTSKPKQVPEMRGKKRRLKEAFLEYLMKKEDNRARERREEIELRRQELDLLRDQNTALMNLLTQHLAK